MTTNTEALKPCPFCGDTPAGDLAFDEGSTFRWLKWSCPSCGVGAEERVQTLGEGSPGAWLEAAKDRSRATWNRRAALAAQPQPSPLDTEALVKAICAERVGLIAKKHTGDKTLKLSETKRLETLDAALSVLMPCVSAEMWDELEASGKRADERETYLANLQQKYGIAPQPAPAETAQPVAARDAVKAAWQGAGIDVAGGDWHAFERLLPALYVGAAPSLETAALNELGNLLCSVSDNLGDMPVSDEWAAKTAARAAAVLERFDYFRATPTAQPAPEAAQTALRSEDSAGVVALQAVPVVVTAPVFETEAYGCAVFKDGVWERIPAATPPQEGQA